MHINNEIIFYTRYNHDFKKIYDVCDKLRKNKPSENICSWARSLPLMHHAAWYVQHACEINWYKKKTANRGRRQICTCRRWAHQPAGLAPCQSSSNPPPRRKHIFTSVRPFREGTNSSKCRWMQMQNTHQNKRNSAVYNWESMQPEIKSTPKQTTQVEEQEQCTMM